MEFLIALSNYTFASMQAKALTCIYTGNMSLALAKGLTDGVKE